MKTRNIYISLLLAAVCAAPMFARQFEQGEKIYVNADQSWNGGGGNFDWSKDNAKLFLYIIKNGGDEWVTLSKESGSIYVGEMPEGDYHTCVVVRKSSSGTPDNWNNIWNQTCDRQLVDNPDINCIKVINLKDGVGACEGDNFWATYAPAVSKIKAFADAEKEEEIHICSSALGGPFSLRPKLKEDKSDYMYDLVSCHGWYVSTDKNTWTSLDGNAGVMRDGEGEKDFLNYNLPVSIPATGIYFYLHTAKKAGRRLIKVKADASDCAYDCTITSFEVACSAVNANDTTFTLDGMVAFGEPNGDLMITCGNKSVTIKAAEAKSPQIFSISGIRAAIDNNTPTKAVAQFKGNTGCKAEKSFAVPNAVEGIKTHRINVLVGETKSLKPQDADYSYNHEWYANGQKQTTQYDLTTTPRYETHVDTYMYQEFNNPLGPMDDMMTNGGYESTKVADYGTEGGKSTISDYDFWGIKANASTPTNYYDSHPGANNGFAVVQSANKFAKTFAKLVTPAGNKEAHEGNYFALFDAKSGVDGGNKKAWYANTQMNTKLKLKKGTTYMFSFWAANINNYGEMDNAAKLQFQINGKNIDGLLLDLSKTEFRNNRWHQCSSVYYADTDVENVTISVVNLNTNALHIGNDFALDDIQFRPISNNAKVMRQLQYFTVYTHEPHVHALKADVQPMACDKEEYDVILEVQYDNPMGKLIIRDKTAGKVVFNDKVPTEGADWDTKKSKFVTIHIDALEPAEHEYEAYFEQWTKSKATAKSQAPQFTTCCNPTIMYTKWENVIFIANADGEFVAFQWHKNGQKMNGETQQRYYAGAGKSLKGSTDTYFCEVTHKDGSTEKSCEYTFDQCPRSAEHTAIEDIMLDGVAVYPTQLAAGEVVTVCKNFAGTLQANLLTLTGQTVSTTELRGDQTTIKMPGIAGMYLLQLHGATSQRTVKINVY